MHDNHVPSNALAHHDLAVKPIVLTIVCFAICASTTVAAEPTAGELAFFEKKIRPVLVAHCYECHAADSKELGGSLMVDSRDGMLAGGESGPVLVVGKPTESLLIQALRHQDLEMPPEKPLPESVINDFVRWIERGAVDPRAATAVSNTLAIDADAAWSFRARQSHSPPQVADTVWPYDPVDVFVLSRMEEAGLIPTRDADPKTLIRRLYNDLIGMPPRFEQVEAFAKRHAEVGRIAVVGLVDDLLANPAFGQRWGRHWLDVARFGESNGDDGLGRNATFPHAWRYRDYVIDAWNGDTPYDQFLTEQIAGDLLPAQTAAQRNRQLTATGFLAIGAKPAVAMNKNFAMDVVDDQINVVCTGVMGLSVACARCHDHKHDPIPTRDYYALAGVFSSTETLYGLAGNEKLTAPPTPLHELRSDWTAEKSAIDRKQVPIFPASYTGVIEELRPAIYERLIAEPVGLKVDGIKAEYSPDRFGAVEGARLDGEFPATGESYTVTFWFKNDTKNDKRPITAYLFSRAKLGDKQLPGDHIGIGGTHDRSRTGKLFVFNGNEKKTSIGGTTVIPAGSWNHIVLVRDQKNVALYLNGVLEIESEIEPSFGESTEFRLGSRSDHFSPLTGNLAEFAVYTRALDDAAVAALHAESGQPKGRKTRISLAMGVRDKKKAGNTKIHINGETAKLGAEVPRGFLTAYRKLETESQDDGFTAIGERIDSKGSGRRELAKWLTHRDHPQTARVIVNRVWQHLFGRAIVVTTDDFGVYGSRPTHPLLLDHLAERMVERDWSIKQLIRAIVLTRTYGLDSRCDDGTVRADPNNVWMARHSRRRLDAESLRDGMLVVSDSIDRRSVEGSPIDSLDQLINWPPGEATNLHRPTNRRSIYLCMLRNSPPPELAAFDLPDGINVAGTRDTTTLPTQALFLLNGDFVVEQSERLARTVLDGSMAGDSRVNDLFRRTLQRDPTDSERQRALSHVRTVYDSLGDRDDEIRRLRSWASLCQALLSTNEFRYID